MSETVIRIDNLSKQYFLGRNGYRDGLRHVVNDFVTRPFRRLRKQAGNGGRSGGEGADPAFKNGKGLEEFWALKNVSFEIKQGEATGVIGRNGAGKSTLLKVLSRITEPTQGRVEIKGRVASLLEVGTGFHPELSGRENIYLNGAILGMRRAEIKRKFDEIVAFAEVEQFLDTPVKRYSSGMYVRLAFAVAAHLEPEILIVDEVLAVGDAQFQQKCLGKMQDVATKEGRTVLFVSHQIPSVTRLCQSTLWLDKGRIREFGEAHSVCSRYLANGSKAASRQEWDAANSAPGNDWVKLEYVEAQADGVAAEHLNISSPLNIHVGYRVLKGGKALIPNIHLFAEDETLIFISHDWHSGWRNQPKSPGQYRTTFTVPGNFFSEGRITVKVVISTYQPFEVHAEQSEAVAFTVVEALEGATSRGDYTGHIPGVVRPLFASRTEMLSEAPCSK
jgi:lipopolysaccharide transport system ATP-binding protein